MSPEIVASQTAPAASSRRRWRLRFSLRGLIVAVTLAAIVFAPLGIIARRRLREQRAIDGLTSLGAVVWRAPAKSKWESIRRYFQGELWHVSFGSQFGPSCHGCFSSEFEVHYPIPNGTFTFADSPSETVEGGIADEQMSEVVRALRHLGSADRLSIGSTILSDAGLIQLRDAPELHELDLRCPLVTSRGTDALQRKFPKLVILDD